MTGIRKLMAICLGRWDGWVGASLLRWPVEDRALEGWANIGGDWWLR